MIPLFELTSCATLEKKIVPAYQQACEQGESVACDDATRRIAPFVEEANAAALQQKKLWRKQSLDFIAVLDAELETAVCYHHLIIGSHVVSEDGIHGIRAAYIPSDAKNTCSDAVTPTQNTNDGSESQYLGIKTGQEIICTGNRQAAPECMYKDEKMVYLTAPQVGSNTLFCKSVKEAISTFSDINGLPKISEVDSRVGNMTQKEIRFDDKDYYRYAWDATLDCYIMDTYIFCEAIGRDGYTTSLACPALIGLLSNHWIPHQEIITALSEQELGEIQTFISENTQQKKKVGEQVANTTTPVVDDSLDYVSAPITLSSSAEQCPSQYYRGLWGIYQTSTGSLPAYNKKTEQFDFVSVSPGDICYDGPYPSIASVSIVHGSTTLPLIRYEDRNYEHCDCFPLPADVLRFDPPTFVVHGQDSSGSIIPPVKFAISEAGTIYPISLDREIYRLDGIESSTPFVMDSTQAPKVTLTPSGLEVTDDNAIGMQAFALVKHPGNETIEYIPLDITRGTAQGALFSIPSDITSQIIGYYALDRNNNKSVTVDPTGKKLVEIVK